MAATRLRCPACAVTMAGDAWNAHLVGEPRHKARVFAFFVDDHPDAEPMGTPCSGASRILASWDGAERKAFGATEPACDPPVLRCACGESYCVRHSMACGRCGRFACLRHRHSGRCPECAPGRRAVSVGVPKHDPFTKETRKVFRRYVRPGPPAWERVVAAESG